MAVQHVTTADFDEVVKGSDKVVFVDFSAVWCGPCQMFKPVFEQFSEENPDKVLCVSVDIDESRELAMRFGIQGVPTTLIFKDGEIVDSAVGALTKVTLDMFLKRY